MNPVLSPPNKQDLLQVRDLRVRYQVNDSTGFWPKTRQLEAVKGIGFDLYAGETLGIVGESGCGKSSLAKALIGLIPSESSQLQWLGQDLTHTPIGRWGSVRRDVQMVFQDPQASLNPRMTLAAIISEPLVEHTDWTAERRLERVYELMDAVGLNRAFANRFPHEFSGGQRQRIGIARALALNPKFIVCDEPIAALDVSIQAQVVNLLEDLQAKLGLTYLFISHDLSMVRHIADRVAVMYLGRIAELSPRDELYAKPLHPYAEALLSAVNEPDPNRARRERIILKGDVPSPANPPKGCSFSTRCPKVFAPCRITRPNLTQVEPGRFVACHLFTQNTDAGPTGAPEAIELNQQGETT